MSKFTQKRRRRKASSIDRPPKPYPDFPLSAANCGAWQKKIRGKIHYFGKWGRVVNGTLTRIQGDGCWRAALAEYKEKREALYAGRTPRVPGEELTVADLCNAFLTAKWHKFESREITARTFATYQSTTDRLIAQFGKDRLVDELAAIDFQALRADIAKRWGPVRLGNEVQRVRTVFKYGREDGLITKEVCYGTEFKKPSKHVLRKCRPSNGKRMFEADEIRRLLDAASPRLHAMILLGINCGFGNSDCASLPQTALDLDGGWIDFPRPKTGIPRQCPLWPDTVKSLWKALEVCPKPKDKADADLVFVTKYGHRWVRLREETQTPIDSVGLEFGKLLRALNLKRRGIGFYALRHSFRTVADATLDFTAIRLIMGHTDASIDAAYLEGIDRNRLRAVADHVRRWLFGAINNSNR